MNTTKTLLHAQGKPQTAMKRNKNHACQTSIDTHPARAPEGKSADRVEIIKPKLSIQRAARGSGRHPCGQSERTRSYSL